MNGNRMFELLTKIGYTRIGGSSEELQTAEILKAEVEKLGGEACIVPFEVNAYTIKEVSLIAKNQEGMEKSFNVTAYGWCGEDVDIEAPFYYFEGLDEVSKRLMKDKVILYNGFIGYDAYKELVNHGVKGFISFNGDSRDSDELCDIDQRELRGQLAELGVIPGVNMHVKSAIELVKFNPVSVHMIIKQEQYTGESRNVVAEIKGSKYPEEVIVFTAHYDSVLFSKGVYDNGAGSVIHMELYKYFMENKPDRTLRFIWCGSEERGLLGSKAYAYGLSEEEMKKILLCVNTDVAGPVLGRDSVCVIGEMNAVHMIEALAREIGFSVRVAQSIYSSDSVPFADCGVPGINFMRFGGPGMAYIHNRHDTLSFMSAKSLENTANFVKAFCVRVVNSHTFPIARVIPQNMVDEVNKYLKKNNKK